MTMEWETCAVLIRYAYRLGGNTRDMARLVGLPHEHVVNALMAPLTGAEHAYLNSDGTVRCTCDWHCRCAACTEWCVNASLPECAHLGHPHLIDARGACSDRS